MMATFNFVENTFMVPYTKEVADYCDFFSCGDDDLDEFFSHDVFPHEEELLGKTYCWINKANQQPPCHTTGLRHILLTIHHVTPSNVKFPNKNAIAVIQQF